MSDDQLTLPALPVADPTWAKRRLADIEAERRGRLPTCPWCLTAPADSACEDLECAWPSCGACLVGGLCQDCMVTEWDGALGDAMDVEDGEPVSDGLRAAMRRHFTVVPTDGREARIAEAVMVLGVGQEAAATIVDALEPHG